MRVKRGKEREKNRERGGQMWDGGGVVGVEWYSVKEWEALDGRKQAWG